MRLFKEAFYMESPGNNVAAAFSAAPLRLSACTSGGGYESIPQASQAERPYP